MLGEKQQGQSEVCVLTLGRCVRSVASTVGVKTLQMLSEQAQLCCFLFLVHYASAPSPHHSQLGGCLAIPVLGPDSSTAYRPLTVKIPPMLMLDESHIRGFGSTFTVKRLMILAPVVWLSR